MVFSPDWLHHQAMVHPERLALKTADGQWTFRGLDQAVGRLAGVLRDRGIAQESRVAFHLWPSAATVMLIHALTRLQAVAVPLNTRLTTQELMALIQDAEPDLVVHDGRLALTGPLPSVAIDELITQNPSSPVDDAVLDFDALHAIVYTSGTTGRPKGVQLTVGNQWWSAVGFALNAGLHAHDRWLHVMPLFHVGGLTIVFRSVIHGSAIILEPRFDAESAWQVMSRESCTLLSVVPTMLYRLLALPEQAPASLRLVLLGGAPAPVELIHRAWNKGYPAVPTYGLTETCSQIVTLDPDDVFHRAASSGRPNLPTEVRIVRDGRPMPAGEPGEIWVRGPTVARGYWRHPDATRDAFLDGWFKTGDWGALDADGFLTVTDRVKDIIIRGGENIYPSEVEARIRTVAGIRDVGVFGLEDPEWGQIVAAAVVVDPAVPLTLETLQKHLSNQLASYKMPSKYFRVDEIPRNASGKILRTVLVQRARGLREWGESE
ncbi:MAG: o-succinylbenzoate--CoA ligase [Firmicutes bacterium]|nr:o-succinylbenzoate--CoA ligase [Bacillota bacterium]